MPEQPNPSPAVQQIGELVQQLTVIEAQMFDPVIDIADTELDIYYNDLSRVVERMTRRVQKLAAAEKTAPTG